MYRILLLILTSSVLFMSDSFAQFSSSASARSPMQTYSFRLRPGQDLKQQLDALVQQQRIEAGAVVTCVGSLTDVTLRLANQEGPSVWQGHFEIVSLVGTLSVNGSHLHLSVSDSTGRTLGGHLLDGCRIYTTAEIVIGVMPDLVYVREPDPTFGYKELVVRKRKKP
ncbi:DNA-binding protein [Fibrisoma montanum]|uniref:DNA-binding protein n=1 Tax=Fibrisoma montanum TaxID=2305895 RepID=A0A418M271_9BACT|nr:PPC domain-containing DNA-binding protein [Fibrisoma montanum]RIV19842.1 DNA-binding protein [Fibrisoma montanum]